MRRSEKRSITSFISATATPTNSVSRTAWPRSNCNNLMDRGKTMSQESLERIVIELDVLIRARYPLIAVNTPEEVRFHRIMQAVPQLKWHRENERGLFIWSRMTGLRQVLVLGRHEEQGVV